MVENPVVGMTVWFIHAGKIVSGTIASSKTIDGYYAVSVTKGIPKLLSASEMFENKQELNI